MKLKAKRARPPLLLGEMAGWKSSLPFGDLPAPRPGFDSTATTILQHGIIGRPTPDPLLMYIGVAEESRSRCRSIWILCGALIVSTSSH